MTLARSSLLWRAALAAILLVHLGITGVALVQHGWAAPFPPFDEWRTTQIFSDLACMGLACIVLDARTPGASRRRTAALAVGIVTLGSIPVLGYLIAEPWLRRDATAPR